MMEFQGLSQATKIPFKLIYFAALDPRTKSKFKNFLSWMNISIIVYICLTDIYDMIAYHDQGLARFLNTLQRWTLTIENIVRWGTFKFHAETINEMFRQTEHFWKLDGFSPAIQKECSGFLTTLHKADNYYLILCGIIATLFDVEPLFTGELPLSNYLLGDYGGRGLYYFHYAMHIYAIFLTYFHMMGFDTICISVSFETAVQMKLLQFEARDLKTEMAVMRPKEFNAKFKKIVDFQNFLYEYCGLINTFCAEVAVGQFVLTIMACCIQLFIVLQDGFQFYDKLKCINFFTAQVVEFGMYCASGEILAENISRVSEAFYESDWHLSDTSNFRKRMRMVMTKAQKPFFLIGHGLVRLNYATLTTVMKSVLSFYAFLKTMDRKKGV